MRHPSTLVENGVDANQALLDQAIRLLDALTDDQYACPRGDWASVGAQYRHVLEHYLCFLEGCEHGQVDYDNRARTRVLETSRTEAVSATQDVQTALRRVARAPDTAVRVQLRTSAQADDPQWSTSTLAREFQFLMSHTVHHFALIKLLLAAEAVAIHPDFGVAPSTLAHARTSR